MNLAIGDLPRFLSHWGPKARGEKDHGRPKKTLQPMTGSILVFGSRVFFVVFFPGTLPVLKKSLVLFSFGLDCCHIFRIWKITQAFAKNKGKTRETLAKTRMIS